ncbi:MAG: TVP38/TMEM64 family protein [Myxococcota bacterium]
MPQSLRRLLIAGALLALVGGLGSLIRSRLGIEFDVESVRAFAEGLGPMAPLLFILVVAGRALLWLPSQVVLIAAGLCFGTVTGGLVGGAGLMISGAFLFSVARYAGREAIEKRMGRRGTHLLEITSRRTGAVAFGLACGYPISPLSPLQAAAGLTPMPLPNFLLSAFVGGGIRAAIFAYFGNALLNPTLSTLLSASALFLAALAIPFAFPSGRAWLREIFAAPPPASASSSVSSSASVSTAPPTGRSKTKDAAAE